MYKALIIFLISSGFILCQSKMEIIDSVKSISGFNIQETYQNPLGASTIMRFCVPDTVYAKLAVFSAHKDGTINLGDTVSVIYEGLIIPSWYKVSWDGKNLNNLKLQSGIFYISLSCWSKKLSISKSFSGYTRIFVM